MPKTMQQLVECITVAAAGIRNEMEDTVGRMKRVMPSNMQAVTRWSLKQLYSNINIYTDTNEG
jgi:hypothetical protein